jgi:CTP:phosphocholine cytidylyltransferase-like protein
MLSKEEQLMLDAFMQIMQHNKSIGFRLSTNPDELSAKMYKLSGDEQWWLGSDLWRNDTRTKRFFAIYHKLVRQEYFIHYKGNSKRRTKTVISEKTKKLMGELSMSKRQVNEKLFKLIVKVLTENNNDIWITHLIELVQLNSTLNTLYIFDFISVMIRKELLSVRKAGDHSHVQLTQSACEKYRELKRA